MTSFDLKRVIGEELARVENRFDKFGKPERNTVFDKVVPGFVFANMFQAGGSISCKCVSADDSAR